jgi:ketosteroid isomerase-like protein
VTALDRELHGSDRVREVFTRVRNGDDRVADLYAEDGVVEVAGRRIRGREGIRDFYRRTIDGIHPKPEVQEVLESGDRFIAVVHVPTDEGTRNAIDLFELGDEGIRRLVIFSRPD